LEAALSMWQNGKQLLKHQIKIFAIPLPSCVKEYKDLRLKIQVSSNKYLVFIFLILPYTSLFILL
jgi:hypothetical protein